ncbi:hypothetical protein M9Y10_014678 [Tritrichomonas musculus]|uniref:t-SNARE coiled-coil homology domain-containing protein n=1 Tax=Tritrichomonas musculus TaxID=1915356 RepID=A0ABR2L1B3_9EUKA
MSFSKIKSQTFPEMFNNFMRQLNEYQNLSKNNGNSPKKLQQQIGILDFQIKRMENAFNDSPDNKKIEYSNLFQRAHSEYSRFKQEHNEEIELYINEQNSQREKVHQQLLVEQSMEAQEAENLEYLANEAQSIARQMKELQEISQKVYSELQSQRPTIVSIDTMISKSVTNMEKGNNQLEKAEKNQKSCNIC